MRILATCLLLSFVITGTTHSMNQIPEEEKRKPKRLLKSISTNKLKKSFTKRSQSAPEIETPREEKMIRCHSEDAINEIVPKLNVMNLNTVEQPLKGPRHYDISCPPLITLVKSENEAELAKALYHFYSSEINACDEQGNTGLIWAIRKQNIRILKLLLTRPDIDINLQNTSGYTALHFAVWIGNKTIVQLLLACHNLLPNKKNCENYTPLHCAARMNLHDIINILIGDPRITLNIYDIDEDKPRTTFTILDNKIKGEKTPHDLIPKDPVCSEELVQTAFRKGVFARYTVDLTVDTYLDECLTLKQSLWGSPIVLENEEIDEIIELVKKNNSDSWVNELDYINDTFIREMIIARFIGITPIKTVKQLSFWQ